MTRKTVENKNILPMDLYNLAQFSIYNELAENKKTNMTNMKTISLIGAL